MADGYDARSRSQPSLLRTAIWLAIFVLAGIALRSVFSVGVGFDGAADRNMFTGNDPYYDWRIVTHITTTGQHLTFDPAINYPVGSANPNPPLWDWISAGLASGLSHTGFPDPVGLALNILVAVAGGLAAIPVFMIASDLWGRKAGLWSAFFMAFSAPAISRTVWGYPRHEAIALFFILLAFAFVVKGLKRVDSSRHVGDWRNGASVAAGLKQAVLRNWDALVYGTLAGLAITATAVAWKGYPYALAILSIALVVQLVSDQLRRRDPLGHYLVYLVAVLVSAILPYILYYHTEAYFTQAYVVPTWYVLAGTIAVGLLLVPTRDLPPVLVLPLLVIGAVGGYVILLLWFPEAYGRIFSGLGYFNQSKLYSTIAEAQRPQIGEVVAQLGFFAFLVGLWGYGRVLRMTWKGDAVGILLAAWGTIAIYMAFAASRFIVNAAPIFAIFLGYVMVRLAARMGTDEVRKRFRATHGQNIATRSLRSLGWKPVAVGLLIAILLVIPSAWTGVDAGIPQEFESKYHLADYSQANQINQPQVGFAGYNNVPRFGAFGINFDVQSEHWNDAMGYLSTLDTNRSLEQRPAFIGWWDYGHWATAIGLHPTVADPFQSHYDISGMFLASDSEEEGVSWLSLLLLEGDWSHHNGQFSPEVHDFLQSTNPALLSLDMSKPWANRYAIFHANVTGDAVYAFYDRLSDITHTSIEYFGVNSRMYPDPQHGGIFYAPVFLANKNPDSYVQLVYHGSPTLNVLQYGVDANGNSYRLPQERYIQSTPGQAGDKQEWVLFEGRLFIKGHTPVQGADPSKDGQAYSSQNLQQTLTANYTRTMFAKAFGGPTLEQGAGDGLTHWRYINQTSFAANLQNGQPTRGREVALLEYYRGVTVTGRLVDSAGQALSGYTVTFRDGNGATHSRATTAANGTFRVLAPFSLDPANHELALEALASDGTAVWNTTAIQPTREEARRGGVRDAGTLVVDTAGVSGRVFLDGNGNGHFESANDTALQGATVHVAGHTVTTNSTGNFAIAGLQPGPVDINAGLAGYANATKSVTLKAGQAENAELILAVSPVMTTVTFHDFNGTGIQSVPIRDQPPAGNATTITTNATGVASASLVPIGGQPSTYVFSVDYNVTAADGTHVRYLGDGSITVTLGEGTAHLDIQRRAS
jgi:asparagine N-glycosylation enzyme membrane subunit Stt3